MGSGHKRVNPFNPFNYLNRVWILFFNRFNPFIKNGLPEDFYCVLYKFHPSHALKTIT